jgi:hypothetical protein
MWRRLRRAEALDLDAGKPELLAQLAGASSSYFGAKVGGLNPPPPISNKRFSYPATAATLDLAELNTGERRQALLDPSSVVADHALQPLVQVAQPRPETEILAFIVRVQKAGGLALLDRSQIARTPDGLPLENGLFPKAKDAHSDRTLCDRRTSNAYEYTLQQPRLPSGTQWSQVLLKDGQSIRFSKKDLPDYFNLCGVTAEKTARNAIGRSFSPAELTRAGFSLSATEQQQPELWLALRTLCMGDLNAL